MDVIMVYANGGYKFDNGYGKLLFGGRAWKKPEEARAFAKSKGLNITKEV